VQQRAQNSRCRLHNGLTLVANFVASRINARMLQENLVGSVDSAHSVLPAIIFSRLPEFGNAAEECEQIAERRSRSGPGNARPFILVADDEPLIRSTIVEILRSEGYDAVGAKDGAEAVACAQKIPPDIFLADVAMPNMNGIEAAKQIKALSPKTRVICFSGHAATSELLAKAKAEGHDFDCLAKPIKPQALLRVVENTPL
jgi:CheY-like chemotaxis protein